MSECYAIISPSGRILELGKEIDDKESHETLALVKGGYSIVWSDQIVKDKITLATPVSIEISELGEG